MAVICLDGCADEYFSASIAQDQMPNLLAMSRDGYRGLCRGALPSFTNVNNTSIVTGVPPKEHGVCGNFFLDPESGEEVMMNGPEFRRCGTLLNGQHRRQSMDKIDIWTLELLHGLASLGRQALHILAIAFGIQCIESQSGLPRT